MLICSAKVEPTGFAPASRMTIRRPRVNGTVPTALRSWIWVSYHFKAQLTSRNTSRDR